MRYMIRPPYSAYNARIIRPSAYATSNCIKSGNLWCWTGTTSTTNNGIDLKSTSCGKDCDEARSRFCQSQGGCLGKTGQKPIVGVAKPLGGSTTKNILTGGPGDNSPLGKIVDDAANTIRGGNTAPASTNPDSGCPNCGNDWWNPGQWSCQAQKFGCEFGSASSKGINGFIELAKKYAIPIAVVVLLSALLFSKMSRMI